MIVTTIKGFTNVLGEPKDWDRQANGGVFGLPVKIEHHGDTISATSAWKPTPDELAALLVGAPIHLRIIGGQPPVSVYVEGLPENLEPDYSESDARRVLMLAKMIQLCRNQFNIYAAMHDSKQTADGDAKAKTNRLMAKACADVLDGISLPEAPKPPHDGYVDAFYDLAKMMDIGARAQSPAEVWRTEMRPKLAEMLAKPLAPGYRLLLPSHEASCHITHNDHLSSYETVKQRIENDCFIDAEDFVSPEERERAIETNELWTVQWYPDTPVGFCIAHASSLEALNAYFEAQQS